MGFADNADDDGTLLDGFLCVFHLEDAALRGAGLLLAYAVEWMMFPMRRLLQGDGVVVVVVAEHRGGLVLLYMELGGEAGGGDVVLEARWEG